MKQTTPGFEIALNDALPPFISPLDGTRRLTFDDGAEGGFVDLEISPETTSWSSSRIGAVPTGKTARTSEERDRVDSIWRNLGGKGESLEGTRVAGDHDRRTGEDAAESDGADRPARDSQWAFDSEEGGMVELAAFDSGHSSRARAAWSESANEEPAVGAQEIRMDKGIGLFQAFELATAPPEPVDASDLTSAEPIAADSPGAATQTTTTADAPAAEESASAGKEWDEPPVHRAAAIPAIVVASLLPAAKAYREETMPERKRRRQDV